MTDFTNAGSTFLEHSGSPQLCCLTEDNIRCTRIAGNASYSKRIQKTVQQKKLRLTIDNTARHVYICDHHKNMIQSIRLCVKKKRKDSCEEENGTNSNDDSMFMMFNANNHPSAYNNSPEDYPMVDLSTLQMNTLRRYKKYYRVQTKPGINKSQLADSLYNHFRTIQIDEKETITYFIYMVKCNCNKLDQVKGLTTNNIK